VKEQYAHISSILSLNVASVHLQTQYIAYLPSISAVSTWSVLVNMRISVAYDRLTWPLYTYKLHILHISHGYQLCQRGQYWSTCDVSVCQDSSSFGMI